MDFARRILLTAGVAAALAAALPAAAQPGPPYPPRRGEPLGPGPMHREFRGDPAQRELGPPHEPYRGGRLTPEERRQLRRDIGDAGRDLYQDRPGRHGPPRRGPGPGPGR